MREKEFLPLVSSRLGIEAVNEMQRKMMEAATSHNDIVLLSPTGSGKTLAFLLPVLKLLRPATGRVQAVIIAPGRELVTQIASIAREITPGFKVTALYGGHKVEEEINSLASTPDIVVATPGRLLDHAVRRNIDLVPVRILVLDEFDKTLELGFTDEMERICRRLKNVSHTYLTSATDIAEIPGYISLGNPLRLDFTGGGDTPRDRMAIHRVTSQLADKLECLHALLCSLAEEDGTIGRTIVFANHRESAVRIFRWLSGKGVPCGIYHGGLDQIDREKGVEMFNNGSTPVLIATDLAARGLDIEKVCNIIHYHQPVSAETFAHRNGRAARVTAQGDIYVILGPEERPAEFIDIDDEYQVKGGTRRLLSLSTTVYFCAGRKDKVSRGDILGFLVKECGLAAGDVGKIFVAERYALVAVPTEMAETVVQRSRTAKVKGKRVKASIALATLRD